MAKDRPEKTGNQASISEVFAIPRRIQKLDLIKKTNAGEDVSKRKPYTLVVVI